jgi:translation initiation factor IF-2
MAKDMAEYRLRYTKQLAGSANSAAILANAVGLTTGAMEDRTVVKLPFVIKADSGGTIEAIVNYLAVTTEADSTTICKADVVYGAVGDVSTSDIALAAASKAKIIAFNSAISANTRDEARANNVDIVSFDVLYDLIDFVGAEFKKVIFPPLQGRRLGVAVVKKIFKIGKGGKAAGCEVTEGSLLSTANARVLRNKEEIFSGKISSLRVVKDIKEEVEAGNECGVALEGFDELEENDIIECFVNS